MKRPALLGIALVVLAVSLSPVPPQPRPPTVVIYGATPSGIVAAVSAATAGAAVILLEPAGHVGGMMANGLAATDIADPRTVGGIAATFFDRIQAIYAARGIETRWAFQPSVAEQVFEDMIRDAGVRLVRGAALRPSDAVAMSGTTIDAVRTAVGSYAGNVFIDASYGGDLMAAAGVAYTVGREALSQYDEPRAGAQGRRTVITDGGPFPSEFTSVPAPGPPGSADDRIQASNYRMCFSADPMTKVPFSRPPRYEAGRYRVIADYLRLLPDPRLARVLTRYPTVSGMSDVNDFGVMSSSLPGLNWTWPDGSVGERTRVEQLHADYDRGLVWFLATDPAVPATVRDELATLGWCASEWPDNDHFPRALYIREARRMIGDRVLTEAGISASSDPVDGIGIGSYRIDSHAITRWVEGGDVLVETPIFKAAEPYAIPFSVMVPHETETRNLLVSVAASASHVAWAALRMEVNLMMLGEAAGVAAAIAARDGRAVGDVDSEVVRGALAARGVPLPGTPWLLQIDTRETSAGTPTPLVVRLRDLRGRSVPSYTGTLRFASSDIAATLPGDIAVPIGTSATPEVMATFRTAGIQTLVVTDTVDPSIRGTVRLDVRPTATVGYTFQVPSPARAGQPAYVTVRAVDRLGNVTRDYTGRLTMTTTDPAAIVPSGTISKDGYETFTFVFHTPGLHEVRAVDATDGAIQGVAEVWVSTDD